LNVVNVYLCERTSRPGQALFCNDDRCVADDLIADLVAFLEDLARRRRSPALRRAEPAAQAFMKLGSKGLFSASISVMFRFSSAFAAFVQRHQ